MTQNLTGLTTSIVNPVAVRAQEHLVYWQAELAKHYGIEGNVSFLDGEYDLNLAIEVDGEKIGVLKVMRPGCDVEFVDMQCQAIVHAEEQLEPAQKLLVPLPKVIPNRDGNFYSILIGPNGEEHIIWVIGWLEGNLYGNTSPQLLGSIENIGVSLSLVDLALQGFAHPYLTRELKWDLQQSNWIKEYLDQFVEPERRQQVSAIQNTFEMDVLPRLGLLSKFAIHNDLNDYNLLVKHVGQGEYAVSGIIDFGDMILAPRVCEIAIAAAYMVLGQEDPIAALSSLVKGYHKNIALSEEEISLIYPLLLTRLGVSVTNSAIIKQERPDDQYVVISEAPAWDFLEKARALDPAFVTAHLRAACGLEPLAELEQVKVWLLKHRDEFSPILDVDMKNAKILDLTPENCSTPENPFDLKSGELDQEVMTQAGGAQVIIGRYCEPRLIYTTPEFRSGSHMASDKRTIHMGVDIFVPAGSDVFAPWDAVVHGVNIFETHLDYGGVLVLKYTTDEGHDLYSLFGHLNHDVADRLKVGDKVSKGQLIAKIGAEGENGGWTPHLHFQLAMTDFGKGCDIPGVVNADEIDIWRGYYPNPAAMFGLDDTIVEAPHLNRANLIEKRKALYSPNLKLSYKNPIPMVRGWKNFLIDDMGRTYLDAYNNVPHVGHAHPRIQKVAAEQLKKINTNTRYLHPEQTAYAEKLTSWMPDGLDCVFFLNSATDANELAIRIARQVTGQKNTIVMATGYHGHTNVALALSEYKFNGKGGKGPEDWIHIVPVTDVYRGEIREDHPNPGSAYSKYVQDTVQKIEATGKKTAAFICETFPSVGGQIILPEGYLEATYKAVRGSGGLCIADETQTGLGRIGTHKFAFETQNVVPDMVVLGKPMGNGHPLGALVTTRKIVEEFSNGMEFFSTFGGSTLSCVVGHELLNIMEDENVQENALEVGSYLIAGLKKLAEKYEPIGDVRGVGLFLGVDLVTNRETREPATDMAGYVANRLQQMRILIGTDGPHDNVLKIRPPLTFTKDDADYLLAALDGIFQEEPCGTLCVL